MRQRSFYQKGLRFQCQGEGKCCRSSGTRQYVYLSLDDRRRLAQFLEMNTRSFTRRYCQRSGPLMHLKEPERDCCFLQGKACAVYEARPDQCRTWPFWPENMEPDVWQSEVASFCPGVGQGRLYSPEEIEALLALAAKATD